jgi:hypothetical protein
MKKVREYWKKTTLHMSEFLMNSDISYAYINKKIYIYLYIIKKNTLDTHCLSRNFRLCASHNILIPI